MIENLRLLAAPFTGGLSRLFFSFFRISVIKSKKKIETHISKEARQCHIVNQIIKLLYYANDITALQQRKLIVKCYRVNIVRVSRKKSLCGLAHMTDWELSIFIGQRHQCPISAPQPKIWRRGAALCERAGDRRHSRVPYQQRQNKSTQKFADRLYKRQCNVIRQKANDIH